jgi:Fe-S-cluster containining protein
MFDRTVREMGKRLLMVRAPEQMMLALRWGMAELEKTYEGSPPRAKALAACCAGCDACCSVPVDVQAHEVFFAADHVRRQFSAKMQKQLRGRLAIHRRRMKQLAAGARDRSRQPCALLVAGSCSIYAGRPEACRCHHSSDAAVCAAHRANPNVDIASVFVPALRARLFAVRMGLDEAVERVGYDDRSYDFGSALHEALKNAQCLSEWMLRKEAFPDDCLSEPPVRTGGATLRRR